MRGIISLLLYTFTVTYYLSPSIAGETEKKSEILSADRRDLMNYVENASVLDYFIIGNDIRLNVTLSSDRSYNYEKSYITYIYKIYKEVFGNYDKESSQTINISIGDEIVDAVKRGELKLNFL